MKILDEICGTISMAWNGITDHPETTRKTVDHYKGLLKAFNEAANDPVLGPVLYRNFQESYCLKSMAIKAIMNINEDGKED